MSEPFEQTLSEWHNPTDQVVRVDIFIGPGGGPGTTQRVTWQPGETKQVPSQYDHAIHTVRDGGIIAGLAPQLRKKGETAKLHSSLETEQPSDAAASAKPSTAKK